MRILWIERPQPLCPPLAEADIPQFMGIRLEFAENCHSWRDRAEAFRVRTYVWTHSPQLVPILTLNNPRRRHLDALDGHLQLVRVRRELQRRRDVDILPLDQLPQVLGEVHHPFVEVRPDGVA